MYKFGELELQSRSDKDFFECFGDTIISLEEYNKNIVSLKVYFQGDSKPKSAVGPVDYCYSFLIQTLIENKSKHKIDKHLLKIIP